MLSVQSAGLSRQDAGKNVKSEECFLTRPVSVYISAIAGKTDENVRAARIPACYAATAYFQIHIIAGRYSRDYKDNYLPVDLFNLQKCSN